MATIQSTIKLNDQMSSKIQAINGNMNIFMTTLNQTNNTVNNMGDALKKVPESTRSAGSGVDNLITKLRNLAAAAGGIAAIKQVIGISDDLTSMTARLDMVDQAFNKTNPDIDAFKAKIYEAANASRGSFDSMASLVARLGNNAGEAFSSSDELLAFAEAVQKEMTIGGASTQEASNAMLQLSQALASGVLRGDELNSIFEQAPNLIKDIADYMQVPMGSIRSLASEGEITADIVKNAMLDALDKPGGINDKFNNMPMTFGQAMTKMQNYALQSFTPVLDKLNGALNSSTGQAILTNLMNNIGTAANIASAGIDVLGNAFQFAYNNAGALVPVIGAAAAAVGTYNAVTALTAGMQAVSSAAHTFATARVAAYANSVNGAGAAQAAFNLVLGTCPLTWICVAIFAVVAAVGLFANHIANAGGTAQSAFAVICGWISVALAWFQNLGTNIGVLCSNIPIAFNNACAGAQAAFYDLLATALNVIAQIANGLNQLPFVSIDVSGLTKAADSYARKSDLASNRKKSYNEYSKLDTKAAYDRGANWGNDKLSALTGDKSGAASASDSLTDSAARTAANTGSTAGSSKSINNKLDDTEEDLKYLCDIAERDVINKFTTASIAVDMVNNNSISSAMDLDTIVDGLAGRLQTSMAMVAEGA